MNLTKKHIILFVFTILTTLITGYSFSANYIDSILFSLSILLILGSHEMGHYYYGKKHNVDITMPYFIPAPPIISIIGTFGAFIKIKSPIATKRALFDIGIAGPIAGVLVAIPVIMIGLKLSNIVNIEQINSTPGLLIIPGDTILFSFLSTIVLTELPAGYEYILHPMAFAGWVGLLVTALNLIPYGQLDGGHILYSLFSEKTHKYLSIFILILLLFLGIGTSRLIELFDNYFSILYIYPQLIELKTQGWAGWLVWGALLIIMGPKHPPTLLESNLSIDIRRKTLSLIALLLFIVSFTPVPLTVKQIVP